MPDIFLEVVTYSLPETIAFCISLFFFQITSIICLSFPQNNSFVLQKTPNSFIIFRIFLFRWHAGLMWIFFLIPYLFQQDGTMMWLNSRVKAKLVHRTGLSLKNYLWPEAGALPLHHLGHIAIPSDNAKREPIWPCSHKIVIAVYMYRMFENLSQLVYRMFNIVMLRPSHL